MATVKIEERGCRGCTLCVDLCPVEVFEVKESEPVASVVHEDRCIGCLSCHYACPSQCIEVGDFLELRPFHRIEGHEALIRRFLQAQPLADTLSEADLEEAASDVAARLLALSETVVETIGKGYRAVGRRAGAVAAEHMPEMYEEAGLESVLAALQQRFAHAFTFDFAVDGARATLTFQPCGLCSVVEGAGQKVGDAVLCQLFHECWAGLISAVVGGRYKCEVPVAGQVCKMELSASN